MKRFVGVFKVFNGDTQYTMLVKTEEESEEKAKKYFEHYNTPEEEIGFPDAWQLQSVEEVDNFDKLWQLI